MRIAVGTSPDNGLSECRSESMVAHDNRYQIRRAAVMINRAAGSEEVMPETEQTTIQKLQSGITCRKA